MYNYFITYKYSDAHGFGRCDVKRRKKITSMVDIAQIEKSITEHQNTRQPVFVIGFQLYDKET